MHPTKNKTSPLLHVGTVLLVVGLAIPLALMFALNSQNSRQCDPAGTFSCIQHPTPLYDSLHSLQPAAIALSAVVLLVGIGLIVANSLRHTT